MKRCAQWLAALFFSLSCTGFAQNSSGTVPLILDGNRIYAEVEFAGRDGIRRKALAFVDLGGPSMIVSPQLLQELRIKPQEPVRLRIGTLPVNLDPGSIAADSWLPHFIARHRKVEALLPAAVLRHYQVVIDYGQRRLTLAQPGTLKLRGTAVPVAVNPKTGLAAVHMTVNGHPYTATLDAGSAYTWLSQSVANEWIQEHQTWRRGVGAVGESNMRMEDDAIEANGIILRIPEVAIGPLRLRDLGALAIGKRPADSWDFMDWYSQKSPLPVIGWLGGNVLRDFRISIDYPRGMSYWQPQRRSSGALDQVGLTLAHKNGAYVVASIATRDGEETVHGIQVGDRLLRVGSVSTQTASSSEVLDALSGKPGDLRRLVVERDRKKLIIEATVSEF